MRIKVTQKITPFLWFDRNAETAARRYVSIFPDSKILSITRCGDAGPGPKESVLTIEFQLAGQKFVGLNGGPTFKFTEAVSFFVDCDSQREIDMYWKKLGAGGSVQACGWLKDRFGLSWQVAPRVLIPMLQDRDTARADRVMRAMMQMVKIDIATIEAAYGGRSSKPAAKRRAKPRGK